MRRRSVQGCYADLRDKGFGMTLPAYKSLSAAFCRIDELIPYVRNARTHSPDQVAQIAASIAEFGWTNPILADEAGVIAGHGRLLAARQLLDAGQSLRLPDGSPIPDGCVPVIDCTGWSDAQRRAYVLADNQLALNAGWDFEMLKVELADLDEAGFNLDLIGFGDDALKTIFGEDPVESPEDFGEADENIDTDHECPKCGYRWSGTQDPGRPDRGEAED